MPNNTLPLKTGFGAVRSARPADTERIVQMIESLARHHGDMPSITASNLVRDAFGVAPWIYVLVAEAGSELIGYAALCGLTRLQFGLRGMDLHHLFIEPAFRGRGIGHSLVLASKIKAASLACSYLTVGTHPDNHKARAFYESLGFERKDAYTPRFSMRLEPTA